MARETEMVDIQRLPLLEIQETENVVPCDTSLVLISAEGLAEHCRPACYCAIGSEKTLGQLATRIDEDWTKLIAVLFDADYELEN